MAQPAGHHNNPEMAHPSDKYARRQRYKTRDDTCKVGNAIPKSKFRKKSRNIEHRKTGYMLSKDFQAHPIRANRLCLRSGRGPGIFARVKTSAHTQTQDLPDLAFPEMEFLKKKPLEENSTYRPNDGSHKPTRDEFSNYFSRHLKKQSRTDTFNQTPGRGQRIPTSSSVYKDGGCLRSKDAEPFWTIDPGNPAIKHFNPKPLHNKLMLSDTQTLTSYAPWSPSPYQKATLPRRQRLAPPASPLSWRTYSILPPPVCQESQRSPPISPEKSVNDQFLQEWTTNALLQGIDSFCQNDKQSYSLDDLKALAQDRTLSGTSPDPREDQTGRTRPTRRGPDGFDHDEEFQGGEKVTSSPHNHQRQHNKSPYAVMHGDEPELSNQKLALDDYQASLPLSAQPKANTASNGSQPAASNIKMGPQYSDYWPSPNPSETLRGEVDAKHCRQRQGQDVGRNGEQGEKSFRQTCDDTYESHTYMDSIDFEETIPTTDAMDQHSEAESDGLDEFDLLLMQADPVNFPPSERVCTRPGRHQAAWHQEEEDNRPVTPFAVSARPMTEPAGVVVDGDEGYQLKPRSFWEHPLAKIHQDYGRESLWATQSGHYGSSGTVQVPCLPQKESPFKAYSRPHVFF